MNFDYNYKAWFIVEDDREPGKLMILATTDCLGYLKDPEWRTHCKTISGFRYPGGPIYGAQVETLKEIFLQGIKEGRRRERLNLPENET